MRGGVCGGRNGGRGRESMLEQSCLLLLIHLIKIADFMSQLVLGYLFIEGMRALCNTIDTRGWSWDITYDDFLPCICSPPCNIIKDQQSLMSNLSGCFFYHP